MFYPSRCSVAPPLPPPPACSAAGPAAARPPPSTSPARSSSATRPGPTRPSALDGARRGHGRAGFGARSRVLRIADGRRVAATVAGLRRQPAVATATPNYVARAAHSSPTTRAGHRARRMAGSPVELPAGPTGVNAPVAWDHLAARRPARRPRRHGRGARHGRRLPHARPLLRSPDLRATSFVRGYDFVDARPVPRRPQRPRHARRLHDRRARRTTASASPAWPTARRSCPCGCSTPAARATSPTIAQGIRCAASRGAARASTSRFEFGATLPRARHPRDPRRAPLRASRKGVLVVGAAGNAAATLARLPGAGRPGPLRRRGHGARLPGPTTPTAARRSTSSRPGGGPRRRRRRRPQLRRRPRPGAGTSAR